MRGSTLVALLLFAACGDVVEKAKETCETAAQCTDSAAPYCVNGACQAACAVNTDCTDPTRDVCATDGMCVGCVMNTDCDAMAPVCDTGDRVCRGCEKDSECPGGVCVEADGTCVADAQVSFVTMMGTDTGSCTRAAPCATIPYAISTSGGRPVIHVLGGSLSTSTLTLTADRILDGEDTTLSTGSQTAVAVGNAAKVTIEGFRVTAPSGGSPPLPAITGGNGTSLRLWGMTISGDGGTAVNASGASLLLSHSHIGSLSLQNPMNVFCPNSPKAVVEQNLLEMTIVGDNGTSCELTVSRNRFESSRDGSVRLSNGRLVMENNLIIHRDGFNDSISLGPLQSGSTVRFNTVVNTTAVASDGAALGCNGTGVVVTSNIFAYNSGHPIVGTCETRYSVFDNVAVTSSGTGNQVTSIDDIFVNRAAGDYHLSANSAAKGNAEPGLNMVKVDYEGKTRPNPAGGPADSGAFEAP